MGIRDNFSPATKRLVMSRAHFMCSHPECRAHLLGGSRSDETGFAHIGQCAHIHAAASGGPRYDENQTSDERRSPANCIYLCSNHATLIDRFDGKDFQPSVLLGWKQKHEAYVRRIQGVPLLGVPNDEESAAIAAKYIQELIQQGQVPPDIRKLLSDAYIAQEAGKLDIARNLLEMARLYVDGNVGDAKNKLAHVREERLEIVAAQAAVELRARNFGAARSLMRTSFFQKALASNGRYLKLYQIAFSAFAAKSGSMREARAILDEMQSDGVKPNIVSYNSLLNFVASENEARAILDEMQSAGVKPDVVFYSSLLNFVASENEARAILDEMRSAGVKPNVVSYSSLLNFVASENEARAILDEMQFVGVTPNEVALVTVLTNAAETLEDALRLAREWLAKGYFVGRGAYTAAFAKSVLHLSADELLSLYHGQQFKFDTSLENPINQYRSAGRVGDALRLLLEAPYTGASIKFYREDYATTSDYFQMKLEADGDDDNLYYAYGIAAHANQDWMEMKKQLNVALKRAYAQKRVTYIQKLMEDAPE